MIWSILKIIVFVALIAAITFAAAFVIDTGGEVRVSFGGQELSVTPLVALISLVLLVAGLLLLVKLTGLLIAILKFFNGDETAVSRYFDRNRERHGFEALADGMVAIAAGEGKTAMVKATKADRYLDRPELTRLLNAQAAEMSGDKAKAMKYYKQLLESDRTRFVGVRGIMQQKIAEGDTETALKLAEKAIELHPKHEATLDTLFRLQSGKKDWSGARKTIEAKVRAKALPKDVGQRRDAVLSLADAKALLENGDIETGKQAALQANRLSPDLIAAAVLASEMHLLTGNKRAAVKVLKKAWESTPHPDLAAAFAEIEPEETPDARNKRFQALLKLKPSHPESRMLKAELALAAEDFPGAHRAIGSLAEEAPTARSLSIMAAIARGEGASETVVRGWLAKALNASRGPQWICSSCNKIHAGWAPICDNCAGFDTLDWITPPESDDLSATASPMLSTVGGFLTEAKKEASDSAENSDVIDADDRDRPKEEDKIAL